jgi:hypothetical protein
MADKGLRRWFVAGVIVTPLAIPGAILTLWNNGQPPAPAAICFWLSGVGSLVTGVCLTILAYRLIKQTDLTPS